MIRPHRRVLTSSMTMSSHVYGDRRHLAGAPTVWTPGACSGNTSLVVPFSGEWAT